MGASLADFFLTGGVWGWIVVVVPGLDAGPNREGVGMLKFELRKGDIVDDVRYASEPARVMDVIWYEGRQIVDLASAGLEWTVAVPADNDGVNCR